MSKKKNTLNDLEEFLKLQASALVTPEPLTEKTKETPVQPKPEKKEASVVKAEFTEADLIQKVRDLASNKNNYYDFIIKVTEGLSNKSKEDTLLINTALYLKGGSEWKEVVSDYYKQH